MKTIKTLSTMPYAQARVTIDSEGTITLVSYNTPVAQIKDGWLTVYGLYSATTRRHLGAFAREYITFPNGTCGDYQMMKRLYEKLEKYNIETGEILQFPTYLMMVTYEM